jgi:hypothetical protein
MANAIRIEINTLRRQAGAVLTDPFGNHWNAAILDERPHNFSSSRGIVEDCFSVVFELFACLEQHCAPRLIKALISEAWRHHSWVNSRTSPDFCVRTLNVNWPDRLQKPINERFAAIGDKLLRQDKQYANTFRPVLACP